MQKTLYDTNVHPQKKILKNSDFTIIFSVIHQLERYLADNKPNTSKLSKSCKLLLQQIQQIICWKKFTALETLKISQKFQKFQSYLIPKFQSYLIKNTTLPYERATVAHYQPLEKTEFHGEMTIYTKDKKWRPKMRAFQHPKVRAFHTRGHFIPKWGHFIPELRAFQTMRAVHTPGEGISNQNEGTLYHDANPKP